MRHTLALLFGATVSLLSTRAGAVDVPSVYDNFHNYPLGSRAAGMAGAYTALACDEGSPHYNVAALACAKASRLELSANAYLIQGLSVPDAFGAGNDIDTINFHTIPSIAGGVRILNDGEADGSDRWVFGFAVTVPHSLVLTADPAEPSRPSVLDANVIDNVTALDVGVGWQINRFIAIGVGVGGGLRVRNAQFDLLSTGSERVPCGAGTTCTEFVQLNVDEEAIALGLHGKLGVRVTPTRALSLGLAVTSPSIDVWGSSKLTNTSSFAVADDAGDGVFDVTPLRFEGTSTLSRPFRIALGVAYQAGPVTLSLDGSVNFPHHVGTLQELEQILVRGVEQLSREQIEPLEDTNDHTWQPNVSLGAEFPIVDPVVMNVGAFTDLSSVSESMIADDIDRVHMFGGTLALGLLGKRARGWFGASFEYGVGASSVLPGALDLDGIAQSGLEFSAESTITRWNLAGFIGSSYSFFPNDNDDDESAESVDDRVE